MGPGWRMPTAAEFDALGTDAGALMGNGRFNGTVLWEFWPEVKKTNSTGFYALPFGYATIVDDAYTFYGFFDYCFFFVSILIGTMFIPESNVFLQHYYSWVIKNFEYIHVREFLLSSAKVVAGYAIMRHKYEKSAGKT